MGISWTRSATTLWRPASTRENCISFRMLHIVGILYPVTCAARSYFCLTIAFSCYAALQIEEANPQVSKSEL